MVNALKGSTVQVKIHAEMNTADTDPDDYGDCEVSETQTHLTRSTRVVNRCVNKSVTSYHVNVPHIPDTMITTKTHTTHTQHFQC